MALSYNSDPFLIISLLSIIFTLTRVRADLVAIVCSQTQNSDLCLSALRADPRSKGANLVGLGTISIDISQKNALFARKLVSKLSEQGEDIKLKLRYDYCIEFYIAALSTLEELPGNLKSKNYDGLKGNATSAILFTSMCDSSFDVQPAEAPQLKAASSKLQGLISIILVISDLLKGF